MNRLQSQGAKPVKFHPSGGTILASNDGMRAALVFFALGLTACGSEEPAGCNVQPYTQTGESAPIQDGSCTIVQLPVNNGASNNGDGGDISCLRPPCD